MKYNHNGKVINIPDVELEKIAKEQGVDVLVDMLMEFDEESAKKLRPNDVKRVIRAIEIFELTGTKKSELHTMQTNTTQQIIKPLIIVLNWNRDQLYDRINQRVDLMIYWINYR